MSTEKVIAAVKEKYGQAAVRARTRAGRVALPDAPM